MTGAVQTETADRILAILTARGMSAAALARQIGWHPITVTSWLRSDRAMNAVQLAVIADALGAWAGDLLPVRARCSCTHPRDVHGVVEYRRVCLDLDCRCGVDL